VVLTPLAKEFGGAKKVLPLQAADFFAWEWRLQVDRAGWWDQPNKPEDWDDRWQEFKAWMEREKPRTRKSIMALMERTQFAGLIKPAMVAPSCWTFRSVGFPTYEDLHAIRFRAWRQ
jgi:hypothetical protein